jgi:DNA-binding NtrC family response regulator
MDEHRVLLVDDEEVFVEALAKRMAKRGLTVDTAANGAVAVDKAAHKDFDVIVLDLAMPGLDGIETLRKLREINADLQVILLTGHGSVRAGVEAMKEGASDFLEKPCDFDELLAKIEGASSRKALLVEQHQTDKVDEILKKHGW